VGRGGKNDVSDGDMRNYREPIARGYRWGLRAGCPRVVKDGTLFKKRRTGMVKLFESARAGRE